jgi:hypothetical protein
MRKATETFELSRKALLASMSARSRKPVIRKVIPFLNDDVPKYLRELDRFEQQSRNANLVVRQHQPVIAA